MLMRWQTWSCSPVKLWLPLMGSRTGRGTCTLVCSVSRPGLGYTSSRPQYQWPLPVGTQSQTHHAYTCGRASDPDEDVPYHSGYRFKIEARHFDDVSKSEYGTERSVLWMINTWVDIVGIDPLHQVTPGNRADLYNTPHSQSSPFSLS